MLCVLCVLCGFIFCGVSTGCWQKAASAATTNAITIEQQYQAAAITYQSTLRQLLALRQAGMVSDGQYRTIEPLRALAWQYLLELQASATNGDRVTFGQRLNAFQAAIDAWAKLQPAPTTQRSQ